MYSISNPEVVSPTHFYMIWHMWPNVAISVLLFLLVIVLSFIIGGIVSSIEDNSYDFDDDDASVFLSGMGVAFVILGFIIVGPWEAKMPYEKSPLLGSVYTESNNVSSFQISNNRSPMVYLEGNEHYDSRQMKIVDDKVTSLVTVTPAKLKATNKTGAAYLKVTSYLYNRQKKHEIDNVDVTASLAKTEATFDSINGNNQKVVCYANNTGHNLKNNSTRVLHWK